LTSPWHGGSVAPLWTVFTLSLRQFLRGRRAIVVSLLALLPAGLALILRSIDAGPHHQGPPLSEIEFVLLFNMIPHALLPLTALLYGSGLILDEQEEQTLTYLFIRPLPKWGIYIAKLLAAMCMVAILGVVFVLVTYVAVYAGTSEWQYVFPGRMTIALALMVLTMIAYVALFGALSLIMQRRALLVGIIYIAMVEGVLANLNFALRQLSVMYYFRVLSLNWVDLNLRMRGDWRIEISEAPSPGACLTTLFVLVLIATYLAVQVFTRREFHVKTPETS
jgi:ABC-2 type transport system permease protein